MDFNGIIDQGKRLQDLKIGSLCKKIYLTCLWNETTVMISLSEVCLFMLRCYLFFCTVFLVLIAALLQVLLHSGCHWFSEEINFHIPLTFGSEVWGTLFWFISVAVTPVKQNSSYKKVLGRSRNARAVVENLPMDGKTTCCRAGLSSVLSHRDWLPFLI